MRELLSDWFGPVLDADGRRVKWRTSRPALLLCITALTLSLATILGAAGAATGAVSSLWWPATFFASMAANIAATMRLRRSTQEPKGGHCEEYCDYG
ncbi:MAG: hypothetical protein F4Z28_11545 [Gammaproteobacteria bacterium]|nr:hypothetical protein [Gammaproteobacteria bacterium]